MPTLKLSDMLARAFRRGLRGAVHPDGRREHVLVRCHVAPARHQVVNARHEHCAVAMADGYARATGKVGVASTTCGPGFTQIMTALTIAACANVPLVVFAGGAPMAAPHYIQQIEMAPLAQVTGAHYIPVRTVDRALDSVREQPVDEVAFQPKRSGSVLKAMAAV
jgi:acetolactate synthase-1/2/3 large subunit